MSTTITSHVLNGVDGTHAGGVPVALVHVSTGNRIAETKTDDGGRLVIQLADAEIDRAADYQLEFDTRAYWKSRNAEDAAIIDTIILRFFMGEASAQHHMPVIISPNTYTTWKSGE